MNSKQEAKMNMYDAVITHCNANAAIVNSVPAMQAAVTDFADIFANLSTAAQTEIQLISGFTADKTEQRKALVQFATDMAAQIFAFASATDQHVLKGQVNYNFTDLNRLKDELLSPACQNILAAANANAAALVPYGITAAKIAEFESAIDNYSLAVPAPRNAVSNRSSTATTIKNLIKEADELLKERLDKIALQFKTTQTAFYNAYKNNRIIIDTATSNSQAAGAIMQLGTDIPLSDVAITVQDQPYNTTSNATGEFTLKIPVPGTYTLIFTKTGYQTLQKENVTITLGQNTNLDIFLTPVL